MDTVEVLTKARELISDESRWTHTFMARDAMGHYVQPTSSSATCWCRLGAMDKVCGSSPPKAAYDTLLKAMSGVFIGTWNDEHSHADVLAAFDRAIATAKEA